MTTMTQTDPAAARSLPHNLDAERAVLGAVLLHDETLGMVSGSLAYGHFFRDAHKRIYRAMVSLSERRVAIDLTTLLEELTRRGDLDEVGGPAYISALVDGVPRSTNIEHYAAIVRAKARQREIIFAATKLLGEAYDPDGDVEEMVDRAEQSLFALAQGEDRAGFTQLKDIMPAVLSQIEHWHASKSGVTGLSTGLADLDAMTCGLQPSDLILVAARPSMGKSALVLNIAQHVAFGGHSVGIFSLEMSETDLAVRALTADASIDSHRLRQGYIRETEWGRIGESVARLSGLKLFIDESPFITALEMRGRARRLKAEHGLDLLIIDYTQLMVGHERRDNRALELGAISRSLKGLAKDLKIPVVALSQLSRKCEERTDKRPLLSDLRESGALEQDADVVVFIYREAVYDERDDNRNLAEFIVAKQRNGPIGTVKIAWLPEQTRFANWSDLAQPEDQRLPIGDR
jgi:replicative DNA helicase